MNKDMKPHKHTSNDAFHFAWCNGEHTAEWCTTCGALRWKVQRDEWGAWIFPWQKHHDRREKT